MENHVDSRDVTPNEEWTPAEIVRRIQASIDLLLEYLSNGLRYETLDPDQARLLGNVIHKLLKLHATVSKHRKGPRMKTEQVTTQIQEWLSPIISKHQE